MIFLAISLFGIPYIIFFVGFFLYIVYDLHIPDYKMEYTCPKNSYTLNYGQGSFTQEEIDIIKSENYCLRLYYEGLYQLGYVSDFVTNERTITKDICLNGLTLPNSKNSCGYASFNFKLADGTTKTVSTCMMLSSAFYETKNLDKLLEEDFKQFNSFGDESIVSFDVEMTNKDGKVLSYNSLTGIVTDPKNDAKYLYKSLSLPSYFKSKFSNPNIDLVMSFTSHNSLVLIVNSTFSFLFTAPKGFLYSNFCELYITLIILYKIFDIFIKITN